MTPYNGDPLDAQLVPRPAYDRARITRAAELEAIVRPVEYFRIFNQRKWLILLCAIVGMGLGYWLASRQRPVYRAQASIEIQGINQDVLTTRQVDPQATGDTSSQAYFNTQVRILQSRPLFERVIAKLNLSAPAPAGGQGATPAGQLQAMPPEVIAASLKVRSALEDNRIVDVSFDAPEPKMAADVVNTLIAEFIQQGLEARWDAAQRTGDWLNTKLEDVKTKLAAAEERLRLYAESSGIMTSADSTNTDPAEQTLRSLQDELSRARADRILKESVYEAVAKSQLKDLPSTFDNSPLTGLQSKLTELRRELAELSSNLTPEHYKVKRVQAQILELEGAYEKQKQSAMERLNQEFTTAQRREAMLAQLYEKQMDVMRTQAGNHVQYSTLRHEVDSTRLLYEGLLQKVREYSIVSAMRVNNVRVVEPALVPLFPLGSRRLISGTIGLIFGALMGMVFAIFRDPGAQSIQRPGDLSAMGNLSELGVIPSARSAMTGGLMRGRSKVELITLHRTDSTMAESFRATVASLVLPRRGREAPRVLVVSSLSPGEGKTTVTSNLGIALAEIGMRVLLIDTDRRRPRLHKVFNAPNNYGWSDILRDASPIEDYALEDLVHETSVENLRVMTAGANGGVQSHLLYSERTRQLLDRLQNDFDIILLDTAPLLAVSDARVLGAATEGVVLVVKAGTANWESLAVAQQRLAEDGTAIYGVVLNDWNPRVNGYGSYEPAKRGGSYTTA